MCIGHRDLFFQESIEALAQCQGLCVKCPLFQDCTRWTLANYEALEFGIFAGLTEQVRARIFYGAEEYYDWRRDWHRSNYTRKLVRRAYKRAEREKFPTGTLTAEGPANSEFPNHPEEQEN